LGGGRNFTKFQPEKYDFNIYKGFSIKKIAQIPHIWEGKKNLPDHQISVIQ